jgi:hypothetical protein
MKSTLAISAAVAALLFSAPTWAQSLTPIRGWVPDASGPYSRAGVTASSTYGTADNGGTSGTVTGGSSAEPAAR